MGDFGFTQSGRGTWVYSQRIVTVDSYSQRMATFSQRMVTFSQRMVTYSQRIETVNSCSQRMVTNSQRMANSYSHRMVTSMVLEVVEPTSFPAVQAKSPDQRLVTACSTKCSPDTSTPALLLMLSFWQSRVHREIVSIRENSYINYSTWSNP